MSDEVYVVFAFAFLKRTKNFQLFSRLSVHNLSEYSIMHELELYINSYFGIPQTEMAEIIRFFKLTTLERGKFFLKSGQICNRLSFHKSGFIRVYKEVGNKEITQWISSKGFFITDLRGIHFNRPAMFNIQALSDCELYTINREDYRNLGSYIPKWHELEKLFLANCFTYLEERIFNLLSMAAEERYTALFEKNPELFNHVPLQYLASMMNMTPETLSRLRRKQVVNSQSVSKI